MTLPNRIPEPPATAKPLEMEDYAAEYLARQFHETYEALAPAFNYETRLDSRTPWTDVPENNRNLMIATAHRVMDELGLFPVLQNRITGGHLEEGADPSL